MQVLGAILLVLFGALGVPLPLAQGVEHPASPSRHNFFLVRGCDATYHITVVLFTYLWDDCLVSMCCWRWALVGAGVHIVSAHVVRKPRPSLERPQMDGLEAPSSSEALSPFPQTSRKTAFCGQGTVCVFRAHLSCGAPPPGAGPGLGSPVAPLTQHSALGVKCFEMHAGRGS